MPLTAVDFAVMGGLGALSLELTANLISVPDGPDAMISRFFRSATSVVGGAMGTAAFFSLAGDDDTTRALAFHYGLIVAAAIHEFFPFLHWLFDDALGTTEKKGGETTLARWGIIPFFAVSSAPLILDGFFEVFGVGALGAVAAEAYRLRRARRQVRNLFSGWSPIVILLSAASACIHGVTNVDATLAFQLGLGGPLAIAHICKK
jgi:hypothetical protein